MLIRHITGLLSCLIIAGLLGHAYGQNTTQSTENTTAKSILSTKSLATSTTTLSSKTTTRKIETTTYPYGYCSAYCNIYGYLVRRQNCPKQLPYCCGTRSYRYCCIDESRRLPLLPDETTCVHSLWWFYNWKVIVGLLGTVMVVMMFGACIYYCCMGVCRRNETVQRVQRRFRPNTGDDHNMNTISDSSPAEDTSRRRSFSFDPTNPNAFTPPAYESLPKDPPKYTDIFTENGQINPAFVGDTAAAAGTSMAAAEQAITAATVRGSDGGESSNTNTDGATSAATGAATTQNTLQNMTPGGANSDRATVGATAATTNNGAATPATPSTATTTQTTPPAPALNTPALNTHPSPSGRNRTTETTAIPSVAITVSTPQLSEVHVDAPPPYTLDDPTRSTNIPSITVQNQSQANSSVVLSIETASSGGNVHRIEVGTRSQPTQQS